MGRPAGSPGILWDDPSSRIALLHEEARRASAVMCRSINAQAEFWMKIGMLAEANPTMAFNDIVEAQLVTARVHIAKVGAPRPGRPADVPAGR